MKWSELTKLVTEKGWKFDHHGGRHDIYSKPGENIVVVGRHPSEEVPLGTMKKIIKQISKSDEN